MVNGESVFLTVTDLVIIVVGLQVTVKVAVLLLAAASLAVTMTVLVPEMREMLAIDQESVPEAVPEVLLAELVQVTEVTPTLSEAVPERAMVD